MGEGRLRDILMISSKAKKISFERSVIKTIRFLEKEKVAYFVLGGLAVGVLGEPRFTLDIDLDIFVEREDLGIFLKRAKDGPFQFNVRAAMVNVEKFGTFRIFCDGVQVDMILASTALEKSALQRRKQLALFSKKTFFPTAEDLILLKLIPGRPKDLIDVESVFLRHKDRLDSGYLKRWAEKICDESDDFRILHLLKKFLKL